MKCLWFYILLIVTPTYIGCKKEKVEDPAGSSSFVKVVQVNSAYLARTVIELPDGSVVLISVSEIPTQAGTFSVPNTPLPAIITKYDINGHLLWQKELPEMVQSVWHAILLANGNIAVAGFEKEGVSKFMGIVLLNQDGIVIDETKLFNPSELISMLNGYINSLDMIKLSNGNIAIALSQVQSTNPSMPRLVIYDSLLNKKYDYTYIPSNIVRSRRCSQINLVEDANGNVIMHGRDVGYNNDTAKYFAFDLKLQSGSYLPVYHQLFTSSTDASTSGFALSERGSSVWVSAGPQQNDTLFNSWFNLRYQEFYRVGPELTLWLSNGNASQTQVSKISGYPKNGYISKVKRCADGGYLLLGTCNININQEVPSEYQIMMIKLSTELKVRWIQYPNTISPSIASDIIETSRGYLISATQLSFGEIMRPIIFKTDKQGIIK